VPFAVVSEGGALGTAVGFAFGYGADTTSLVIFAICASTFETRVLDGVADGPRDRDRDLHPVRARRPEPGGRVCRPKVESDQSAYFTVMLAILALAAIRESGVPELLVAQLTKDSAAAGSRANVTAIRSP
jgi:hypothetical protein